MVEKIGEALGKKRRDGEPSTRTPNLKCIYFAKNGYSVRLMADTNMSATVADFLYLHLHFRTLFSTYGKFLEN